MYSRSWKVFPNSHLNVLFNKSELNGLDGEMIVGNPWEKDVYRRTNGALQRKDGTPPVTFYVFDFHNQPTKRYSDRYERLWSHDGSNCIRVLEHHTAKTEKELLEYEVRVVDLGYEGVMIRDPQGYYKHGRATANSGELLKLKRFIDSEAVILGVVEEMHNGNTAEADAFGRTKRSSHKENKTGKNRMGSLVVRDSESGVEFEVGTGFTAEERENIWKNKEDYIGCLIKYKYFPVGVKDKPRHPVFLGFRMKEDT